MVHDPIEIRWLARNIREFVISAKSARNASSPIWSGTRRMLPPVDMGTAKSYIDTAARALSLFSRDPEQPNRPG